MASQRVAQYESDTDTDDTEYVETEIVKKRSKQTRRKWTPLCTINNKNEALEKIKILKKIKINKTEFT
ncbi:hypothetical protein BpHYR1_018881 [Brachionus plicatilis]|uniref:Uncharacterized protein n=1 Tax=Brachionus plicatilis TaxID=10195 RepID=A0A3M7PR69_BRAPC|nr:hypothetical protein BpHYR1_018881 [Brachionus plicatilis]